MKTTVHIISHSHWDREWYLPFEKHRVKLIELMDNAMELFEKDERYRNFHLDGQTIVLDDYLEIRPEKREKLKKYVQEGRFHVGPWYILQDEFLTSGEAAVRNLLTGMREAKEFGGLCPVGYFPDAFGNAGQMPQLLKQAGMKAVAFGRGVKPVGFNNEAKEGGAYESTYSEMNWESMDGSGLLGILFANWYNNGAEIPVEPEEAKEYWDQRLKEAKRFAGTSQLLFMNGCDHQPVQKDLGDAIETARKLYPDIDFIHSDFETYVQAVEKDLEENPTNSLSTVRGELTSQETDGFWTLVNTCSSHVELKKENRRGEAALEKEAEPLAALAALAGKEYPEDLLRYSWKKLMQNHPHDSICGCSVDAVNDEMKTRFDKSRQVAETVTEESAKYLADQIDTENAGGLPFIVFNPSGWERSGLVEAILDYELDYDRFIWNGYDRMKALSLPEFVLKDADGNEIPAKVEDLGANFGYFLPDDRFREPYMARQLRVTFEAEKVPALGHRLYQLKKAAPTKEKTSLVTGENTMENAFLKVEILKDGTYTLTEKNSGRTYGPLGYFEDTGDIGNEYLYVQPKNTTPIVTKGTPAKITLEEDLPYRAVHRIESRVEIPESADETLAEERRRCSDFFGRKAGRSEKTVPLVLTTKLSLEKNGKGVSAETTFENLAKDHRVRVILPTGLATEQHFADCPFELVKRNNHHSAGWKNPSGCEHQQRFTAMEDEKGGLLAANFGLYEYEILPEEDNAIAITLLRAVGEMGDWGVFPTPKAQLPGTHTARYGIYPFEKGKLYETIKEGAQFQTSLLAVVTDAHKGSLPAEYSNLSWSGEGIELTALKARESERMPEGENDLVLRFVNHSDKPQRLTVTKPAWAEKAFLSNVIEEELERLPETESTGEISAYKHTLRPYEILTLILRR